MSGNGSCASNAVADPVYICGGAGCGVGELYGGVDVPAVSVPE